MFFPILRRPASSSFLSLCVRTHNCCCLWMVTPKLRQDASLGRPKKCVNTHYVATQTRSWEDNERNRQQTKILEMRCRCCCDANDASK